jgi:hypothetical protein
MFQLYSTVPPIHAAARMRSATRRALLALAMLTAALVAHAPGLQAQLTIACPDTTTPVDGVPCALPLVGTDPLQTQRIRIQVTEGRTPAAGALVRFRATAGTLLPDTATVDSQGFAHTLWYRAAGSDAAVIAVDARTGSGSALREIRMTKPVGYVLREHLRDSASWFEKTLLPRPLIVEIIRANAINDVAGRLTEADSLECRSVRVAFSRATGGSLTPDTTAAAITTPYNSGMRRRTGCFATAHWTLGEGAGVRHARAAMVGAGPNQVRSNVAFEARARAMPRLVGGILASRHRSYIGLKPGAERNVRIERTLVDGSTMSFDTAVSAGQAAPDFVPGRVKAAAFVGISTPVVTQARWLAVTAGVEPANIERDWYAGISALRIPFGLSAESLPVDVHILGHFGRSPVLKAPTRCAETGECRIRERTRFHGMAAMLSVDAGSLITDLIKNLSGG